jgi:diaminopimelate decarboxylase
MDYFFYRNGELYCEEVPVRRLAEEFGTPLWVYSARTIVHHYHQVERAFQAASPLICYSVKANSNLAILRLLSGLGSGFDVVSSGELYRVLLACGSAQQTVFAGVGKKPEEIEYALRAGVLLLEVESEGEVEQTAAIAQKVGREAPIALRVNPDVDPKTHRYITTGRKESKFGLDLEQADRLAERIRHLRGVRLCGVHMHIGSQITDPSVYEQAAERVAEFALDLGRRGHEIRWFNCGGGFGIHYRRQEARPASDFAQVLLPAVRRTGARLILEPGRFIVGNAGILVSRVLYVKEAGDRRFLIQDAAMNDLVRPVLYQAFHRIWPVVVPAGFPSPPSDYEADLAGAERWDVVGPVCETGDFLALDRPLPRLKPGDLLATFSAGAYGMVMSSNYNSRPRAAEVLVEGDRYRLVRRRETYEDLVRPELEAGPERGGREIV